MTSAFINRLHRWNWTMCNQVVRLHHIIKPVWRHLNWGKPADALCQSAACGFLATRWTDWWVLLKSRLLCCVCCSRFCRCGTFREWLSHYQSTPPINSLAVNPSATWCPRGDITVSTNELELCSCNSEHGEKRWFCVIVYPETILSELFQCVFIR